MKRIDDITDEAQYLRLKKYEMRANIILSGIALSLIFMILWPIARSLVIGLISATWCGVFFKIK